MSARLYLYAGIAVAALLAFAGTYIKGRSDGAENERQTQQAAIAKATEQARAQEAADRAERDRIETEHLGRVRDLQDHIDQLMRAVPAVRVRQHSSGCVPGSAAATASTATASAGRESAVRDGDGALPAEPDVSGDLVQLIGRCERDRQTLIALQEWVTATR